MKQIFFLYQYQNCNSTYRSYTQFLPGRHIQAQIFTGHPNNFLPGMIQIQVFLPGKTSQLNFCWGRTRVRPSFHQGVAAFVYLTLHRYKGEGCIGKEGRGLIYFVNYSSIIDIKILC